MPDATHCTYRLTCSRLPRLKHSRVSLMSCTTCSSAWLNLGEPRNVSLVLATWATDYIDGLTATRYRGPATGRQAQAGLNSRVGRFAGTCQRAVRDAALFEERIQQIHDEWRTRLGGVRANSAADLLLTSIAGAPVLTVRGAATLIGRSSPQANEASQRLVSAGILTQVTASRRNRAFASSPPRRQTPALRSPPVLSRHEGQHHV